MAPVLFNSFVCDPGDGTKCTLRELEDTELGRVADRPEHSAAVQSDLDRLENWAEGNPMKLNLGP